MKTKHVVAEVLPGRIDVVVYDGARQINAHRIPITASSDPAEWAKAVRNGSDALRTLVEEHNLAGCTTTVLYRSPTQAVDLVGFAVRSPSQAVEAATLSCLDSLPYSALSAVCEAVVIGRDAAGESRQTHAVVAADREDIAEALVHLITESGLEFVSATPLDAAVTANLLSIALRDPGRHHGWLYIGEYTSFFVIAGAGTLLFSRRVDLGLDTLARSLTRPVRAPGAEDYVELDIDVARQLLQEHGIPDRDTLVDEANGLKGAQIIPLLQPVLQRFIVEIRQSLRFGVDEKDRQNLSIMVTGPGSSLPGFTKLIGTELELNAEQDPGRAAYDWNIPGSDGGEMGDALRDSRLWKSLNLLPNALAHTRRAGRLRRWLWTGAAAALVIIAVDGFRYGARVDGARKRVETYASQLADLEAMQATGEKLRVTISAMQKLDQAIREQIDLRADYRACLQELSYITPESIRFTTISFAQQEGHTIGTIEGYAFTTESQSGRTALEPFIDSLRSSPLFQDPVLGNVQVGSIGTTRGERFEASFVAVGVPRDGLAAKSVAAAEGGSP